MRFSVFLVLFLVLSSVTSFRMLHESEDVGGYMEPRGRRSEKVKMCGRKVWKMVITHCGGECTSTEARIASICCEGGCTIEEIVNMCCPAR